MADVSTASRSHASGNGATATSAEAREVRRRRQLPGGRAVVGGFLVAVAALGVFAAQRAADGGPAARYVVVGRDVDAGERLAAGDLELVALELPAAQRRQTFTDQGLLTGATALSPMAAGQLIQASDVAKPFGGPGLAHISIPVEPARALNGQLQRGDRVDVLVTYNEGGSPVTTTVSDDALVVEVVTGDATVGSSGAIAVELAVRHADVEEVAQAGAAGTVTLARTTGT